ncbi:MAG: GDSL-type esterase/lipase family protein [Cyanobacteria bacterium P01_E01_bin.6]
MQMIAPQSYQRPYNTSAIIRPLRWIAVGDSTIYGFGDPEGGGWVERLRRRWMLPGSPGHALYNLGVRGDGVQNVARRLDAEFRCRGELRNQVPDLIVLSVGINDSARAGKADGRLVTDSEVFQHEMLQLLDHARALCPVLFVGMTPVDSARMPFAGCLYYNHSDQRRFKNMTRLACEQRNIPYLDVFDEWVSRGELWWRSHLSADGLHPNSLGYQALLQDFLQWDDAQPWIKNQ